MKVQELSKKFKSCRKRYITRQNNLEAQRDDLDRQLKSLTYPSWIEKVIEPIGKELLKQMPDRTMEIFGPFGLNCETSIHFDKIGVGLEAKFSDPDNIKSITFRPDNLFEGGNIVVVDYETDTGQFPKGSIGQMNGGNHCVIPIDEDLSIADLMKFVT